MKTKRLFFSMSRKGISPNPLAKLDKFINNQDSINFFEPSVIFLLACLVRADGKRPRIH